MTPVSLTERVLLALILAIGAGLRVWLLLGPFSQIDADEAVVGLMAMQLPGEVPAFYWEQHYLGTIEPLVVSALFAVAGPSAAALKLVPAAFSMVFVRLVYLMARPISGPGPALISACTWRSRHRASTRLVIALSLPWSASVNCRVFVTSPKWLTRRP